MKVAALVALVASALASAQATGLVGQMCADGTTAPPATPEPTTTAPPVTPEPTTTAPPATPDPTSKVPPVTPGPTTTAPPATPDPTTTAPPVTPDPTSKVPPVTPDVTTTAPPATPDPTTTAPPATPDPTTTAPPLPPVDCLLFTVLTDPSPWSVCANDGTGAFFRTKVLGVATPAANGGKPCASETDPSRQAKELCPAENCQLARPEDDKGPFGECADDGTGAFVKSKLLTVLVPAKNGGTCDRTFTLPCEAVDCEAYTAETDPGAFGECQDVDGKGVWYKTKVLGVKTPAQYGGKPCESDAKRTVSALCPAEKCKPLSPEEDQGEYGACELVGGKYVKSKVLGVKEQAKYGGTCLAEDRTFSVPCEAIDCVAFTPEEDTGDFSACQDLNNTGKFYKSKVLGVKVKAQYGGADCVPEDQRTYSVLCEPVNCVPVAPEDDKNEFGACAKNETTGIYYKSKVLEVKEPAKNGGTCLASDRTVQQLCPAVNCETYAESEDPGAFGQCEPVASGAYYKSKVLGVKVAPQYGGKECASKEDRTVSVLCPAVNCQPVSPEDDTGDFGACTKNTTDGVYYKSKVLGVKVREQYGGTCLDEDRTYSVVCPAVNCVAYTINDDPGQFGACEDDGTNKFYKSKVLGIKIEAQYGGLECESVAKRTVSEFCPPVNCVPVNVADDEGPYDECKLDAVTGKFFKTKVLGIKEKAQNGGTCLESDRTVSAPCASVDCVVNKPAEDNGPFGQCIKETNSNEYYKSKVLDIKTPAQYGGLCPTEAERTYKELCPPVNCVPVAPEDDKGEFGPCVRNATTGVFYKSKVLGVKTDEKNGGTCLESDRTISEVCKAVNCEIYSAVEDPGEFGQCAPNASGKYYKSKVLGVKTQPQYGGAACPSDDQRTVTELCPAENCKPFSPEEDTGAFGECEKLSTGKYARSKVLGVKVPEKNGGTCLASDRTIFQDCPAVDCVAYTLSDDPGQFGTCVNNGFNKYYKSKVLGIKVQPLYGGKACESVEKRTVYEFCPPVNCIPFNVAEDPGAYGECQLNRTTGKYYKTKVLGVKTPELYGGTCLEKDRTVTAPCESVDCVVKTPEEDDGPFSACTKEATSNKYYKSKVLGIKTQAQYGGLCPSAADRTYKELCPPVNCVPLSPSEDKGAFGACIKNTTTGFYYKSKVLGIKTQAQYGGTCLTSDRTYTEQCPPVNCVAYTISDDPGQFGDCKDNGSGAYYKSKILGIKTAAQYGGLECAPEEQRRVYEFCPPVNCVPLSESEDKGAYGDCKDDGTGKYYKSKVLGIKTPAKNGGTCLPQDRTVSQFCTPVPCVIYTAKEDPGVLGPCTKNTTDSKYYKSKVLGVKTKALYGGSCPADTDPSRLYRELCPAVDCVVTKEADDKRPYGTCSRFPDGKYYRTKVLPIITDALYGGKACPSEADRTVKQLCPDDGYCLPSDPLYDTCVPKLAQCGAKVKDKVYEGYELELVTGVQLYECCDKCATTAGCVAYSFTPDSNSKNNKCSLKWKIGDTTTVKNAISSAANAVKPTKCSFFDDGYNTLPTSNIKEVSTNSLAVCCDECSKLSNCVTFNLKDGKCELKAYSFFNIVNYLFAGGWRSGKIN